MIVIGAAFFVIMLILPLATVIYISGNSEKNGTQVVSYIIMQKLNSGSADYEGAAAIALILLIISFILLFAINMVQIAASRRTK